ATWVAYVSAGTNVAPSRIAAGRGWVLANDTDFVDTIAELAPGHLRNVPNVFETGARLPPDPAPVFIGAHGPYSVWTSTSPDGGTWYRLDGVPLLAASADLPTSTNFLAPLAIRGDGTWVEDGAQSWVGATAPSQPGTDGGTCSGWTTTAYSSLYGLPLSAN